MSEQTANEQKIEQIKSPVSVDGAIKTGKDVSGIVTEVITLLGSKGMTVDSALLVLERSQEAIRKCTILQTEYTP